MNYAKEYEQKMIDLKELLMKYPDAINNRSRLKGLLWDLYPEEKRSIHILMTLYDENIVTEIRRKSLNISSRFSSRLESDYGISAQISLPLITLWQDALSCIQSVAKPVLSETLPEKISTLPDFSSIKVGDILKFGSYWQEKYNSEGKTPIEWQVLELKGPYALMISKFGLNARPYNIELQDVTWESCTLRSWLNREFYQNAFSTEEQNLISMTNVIAEANPQCDVYAGFDTQDRIFLLSIQEVKKYFSSDESRQCEVSSLIETEDAHCNYWWWLRSPGYYSTYAATIDTDGTIYYLGGIVSNNHGIVRPAFWINLQKTKGEKNSLLHTDENNITASVSVPTIKNYLENRLVKVGDILEFGNYWRGKSKREGKYPIEWQVLAVESSYVLLISKYGLDAKPYHQERKDITWENCTLRSWLNREFYQTAFSEEEQKQIALTNVKAEKNPVFGTAEENDTQDKIFILNIQELKFYFRYDDDRQYKITPYADAQGADGRKNGGMGWCYLRSPGKNYGRGLVACIHTCGSICCSGTYSDFGGSSIRPVCWVNLENKQNKTKENEGKNKLFVLTSLAPSIKNMSVNQPYKVGDIVKFGKYWQGKSKSEEKTSIEWLVIDVKENYALLISKYCLDVKPYNNENMDVVWENCSLRNWLNGSFYRNAFSEKEQTQIEVSDVTGLDSGKDTLDRIFLLSIKEAEYYFYECEDRRSDVTPYVKTVINRSGLVGGWWLRSLGRQCDYAAIVNSVGSIRSVGEPVGNHHISIRPVLKLNLGVPSDNGRKRSIIVGDVLKFGSYWQGKSKLFGGKTPIEWLVLDVKNNCALLISKFGIDTKPFNKKRKNITWENSTLRSWLNGDFFMDAFSTEEQMRIAVTNVKAENNPNYGTDAGNNTQDRIFLLSIQESEKYFDDQDRACKVTAYAKSKGAYSESGEGKWWLRSPGYHSDGIALIPPSGAANYGAVSLCYSENPVESNDNIIRPAFWLKLDADM